MDNKGIAAVFHEIADILDIQGENFFRINAYRKAALTILNMPTDLRDIVDQNPDALTKVPGIGFDLKRKIIELVRTGKCAEHERLKKSFPLGLLEILRLRGVGPKKVKLFYGELGIKNVAELKLAARKNLLKDLPGMGEKSEREILQAIEEYAHFSPERSLISEAQAEAEHLIVYMKKCPQVGRIEYAGSLRRCQETIGDLDILVTVKAGQKIEKIMEYFVKYPEVLRVTARGDTKSSLVLQSGMQCDLRVVESKSFGAAWHYFTGSKEHNVRIRDIAKKRGLKINEYGIFRGQKMLGGKDEKDIFGILKLPFMIPEIRKNDGEFEYAAKHKNFPNFIELKDVKGDLHSHSIYSDGKYPIAEMAKAFEKLGYEYFAITDHSPLVGVAGGMSSKEIHQQWKEVDQLNKKLRGKISILKGAEVDIRKDGSLDFPDEILRELDVVIISAHLYTRLPEREQTARLIAAIENPHSRILAHPTGRLINQRAEMIFDMEKVIEACVQNNVALEINANPMRLDLSDKSLRIAKDKGAIITINTDAHSPDQTEFMQYGVGMARRGWLESKNVLNTMSLEKLTRWLHPL